MEKNGIESTLKLATYQILHFKASASFSKTAAVCSELLILIST